MNYLPYNVLYFGLYWYLKIYDHFHHLLKYVLNTRLYLEREKKAVITKWNPWHWVSWKMSSTWNTRPYRPTHVLLNFSQCCSRRLGEYGEYGHNGYRLTNSKRNYNTYLQNLLNMIVFAWYGVEFSRSLDFS